MTRDQLRKLLPEGTGEGIVTKLLDAMHAEIRQQKEEMQREIAAQSARADEVMEKARAYDELLEKYEADMQAAGERAREAEFQAALEAALREKGVRSAKAAMALLDMEALRTSENRKEDIRRAVEALAASEEGAFLFDAEKTGRRVNIGGNRFRTGSQGGSVAAIRRAAGLK